MILVPVPELSSIEPVSATPAKWLMAKEVNATPTPATMASLLGVAPLRLCLLDRVRTAAQPGGHGVRLPLGAGDELAKGPHPLPG